MTKQHNAQVRRAAMIKGLFKLNDSLQGISSAQTCKPVPARIYLAVQHNSHAGPDLWHKAQLLQQNSLHLFMWEMTDKTGTDGKKTT